MPVYNRQKYIERAIESVQNQTYQNWQLVIVDDGSTDLSKPMLEKYNASSAKIKVLYQTHKRLPAARNNGIKNSRGDFITFLDSDDEYSPQHIELRVKCLRENKQIDFIHGGVKIIGNEFVPDKNNPNQMIHLSECTIGATFFGKRKVFTSLAGFKDIRYSEDSEFLERVKKNYKVLKVDFPTYVYHREVPDSITNNLARVRR
jgi:glycosyltransferase involved in cell wall biosynthesis